MFKKISSLILLLFILSVSGCATTLDNVNKGAKEVGKTGGKVMRIPGSVSEGAAEGIAGEEEDESNPYKR